MTRRTALALPALVLGGALLAGPIASCARNPVTGKNELSLVSESQEIEMGRQASQEVAQTHRLRGRSRAAGVRRGHRQADGGQVGAARSCPGNSTW